jgi:hypothetical protein
LKTLKKANILLLGGTNIINHKILFSSKSRINLLNFKDIRRNKYHIKTIKENSFKYLCITQINLGKKSLLEKLLLLSSDLYYTKIHTIEVHHSVNQKVTNHIIFMLWYDCLSHSRVIMM